MDIRVGTGVDVHAFSDDDDRILALACLHWPGERALAGTLAPTLKEKAK